MAEIVKANIANALNSLSGVLGTSDQIVDSETGKSIKSDLHDLEEKLFYISDLTLDELVPYLGSGTITKLYELRQHLSNKSLNLILIKGSNGTVYGTYAVATVVENGSSFSFFVDDNGTTVEVSADSQNHWTCTRTTPYVKPADGIPSTDLSSAVLTSLSKADSALQEKSVFIAEYGVTTYNEISSALANGKLPIVLNNNCLYVYALSSYGYHYFTTAMNSRIYYVSVNTSNVWGTGGNVLEGISNKKDIITGNETSNVYYPTTKAVANYVNDKISNVADNSTIELGANGLLVKNGGITNSEIANNTITSNKFNSEISAYVANMCVAQIDLIQSTDPQASPDLIILQLPDNDAIIDISTWGELKSDDKYTWFEDRQYSKFIITYGGISYIVKLEDVNSINNPTSKNEVLIFSNRDIKIAIRTSPNDGDDAELYTDGIVYNNVVWEYDNQVTPIRAKNKNIDSITNEDWQLTDLPLSQYKRLKFYITSGESSNNINPSMILEMSLDDDMACVRGTDNIKYYNCTGVGLALNNDNRLYAAVIYVDRTKSKVCFGRLQSIYGTASTNADAANRFLYKIEGYYN